jgi:inner membrane protein
LDNLTHSLAGLIVGDAAVALRARFGSPPPARYRAAALTAAVFANNAPDLDFVYVSITGGRLGYLLHHRGNTHTLAALLPLSLLCIGLVAALFRKPKGGLRPTDYAQLGAVAVVGGLLHMLMDFGNNYGVHPFWPIYDGWFYGDAIFIIEPWLMIIALGMALGASSSRLLRAGLCAALLALLGLAWTSPLAGAGLAGALTLFGLVWLAALWRASFRARFAWGGGALAALWCILLVTRHVARQSVHDTLAGDPSLQLIDLVSTPAPGNPLCWSLLAVQASPDSLVVRTARASGWPWLASAERCRAMNDSQTARLVPSSLPDAARTGRRVVFGPELQAPRRELSELQEHCVAAAFLRFARVPFWLHEGGRASLIGDLRFDRSSALEFAELLLVPEPPCPRNVPPWLPPLGVDP